MRWTTISCATPRASLRPAEDGSWCRRNSHQKGSPPRSCTCAITKATLPRRRRPASSRAGPPPAADSATRVRLGSPEGDRAAGAQDGLEEGRPGAPSRLAEVVEKRAAPVKNYIPEG